MARPDRRALAAPSNPTKRGFLLTTNRKLSDERAFLQYACEQHLCPPITQCKGRPAPPPSLGGGLRNAPWGIRYAMGCFPKGIPNTQQPSFLLHYLTCHSQGTKQTSSIPFSDSFPIKLLHHLVRHVGTAWLLPKDGLVLECFLFYMDSWEPALSVITALCVAIKQHC